jgi:sugar lactone lactonase YvrE
MTRYDIHQAKTVCEGVDHCECLNFGLDGRLYAGGFAGQVYVMSPPKFEPNLLANAEGILAGVAVDGHHNVYVCNATKHKVLRVTQSGQISTFCETAPDGPLAIPNYGSFDHDGNYYFSDSGDYWKPSGRLIRVSSKGKVESLIGGNWHFSNGIAISPKDGSIFMIESTASDILRIPICRDGTVERPEIYTQLTGVIPDGLAFAANGNLYCSCYYPNRIYMISPDQNVELLVEDSTGEILNQPTNIAFEPGGTRLFYANLGGAHLGALDVGEKGMSLFYPNL